jgi:hypothetical protein
MKAFRLLQRWPHSHAAAAGHSAGSVGAVPANIDWLDGGRAAPDAHVAAVDIRLPESARAAVSFTMNDARHRNSFARSQFDPRRLDRRRRSLGAVRGRRSQSELGMVRFGHTGELGALVGQSLADMACGSAVPERLTNGSPTPYT